MPISQTTIPWPLSTRSSDVDQYGLASAHIDSFKLTKISLRRKKQKAKSLQSLLKKRIYYLYYSRKWCALYLGLWLTWIMLFIWNLASPKAFLYNPVAIFIEATVALLLIIDCILKLHILGWKDYIKAWGNIFDVVIITITIVSYVTAMIIIHAESKKLSHNKIAIFLIQIVWWILQVLRIFVVLRNQYGIGSAKLQNNRVENFNGNNSKDEKSEDGPENEINRVAEQQRRNLDQLNNLRLELYLIGEMHNFEGWGKLNAFY